MAHKTSTQTPIIYNMVYNGIIAAQLVGSAPTPLATATTAQQAAADAIASKVDTDIGILASLASGASVTQPPGTAAEANALGTIPASICTTFALCTQRLITDPSLTDNATLILCIEATINGLMATNCIT